MTKNLSKWENYLQPFFNQITLLGEIPLTHQQVDAIGQEIRGLIQRKGLSKATKMMGSLYCRTFVTYLVHVAAHNTEREYWGVIEANLDVAKHTPTQQGWKHIFIKTLKKFGLPTFESAGGYRYVTPIRLHAGIPAYSLPDFFEYILLPSVQQSHFAELPTTDLVNKMLGRSTVKVSVDSSVRYFLEYGQKNAPDYVLEFMENCQQMARFYLKNYDLPRPTELNLPPYVVSAFHQFMEEGRDTKAMLRMRLPYISLNPWEPELNLHLPQQPVEGIYAAQAHIWQVEGHGTAGKLFTRTEQVRVRQRGLKFETHASQIPLDKPVNYLQISFCRRNPDGENLTNINEETLLTRRLHLMPTSNQPPLLAFQPHNRRQVRWELSLPAAEYWLMYPRNIELRAENARNIQEFPKFYGDWENWQLGWWNFEKASLVHLLANEGDELCASIPIQERVAKPELVRAAVLLQTTDPDDIPLYIGEPPHLRIPIRPRRTLTQELPRWSVELASRWTANPVLENQYFPLEDYVDQIESKENTFEFPLSALLGNRPAGSYEGVVRGPMGSRTYIRFRIWPELEIEGLEPYYLPTQNGAIAAQFTIALPKGCQVQPQAGVEGITITPTGRQFTVTVDPDISLAELHLVLPQIDCDSVRVSLLLAIPRLRWAFPQGSQEREMVWHTSPITRAMDAVLQAIWKGEPTALHVELPTDQPLSFALHLVNPENGEHLQESRYSHEAHRLRTHWRFPLGQYADTLRNLPDLQTFEFRLVILDECTNDTAEVPLLRLNRTLDICYVWIEHLEPPAFRLEWEEPHPLRNRRVRIWSEWQPWNPPIEIEIPDDARGELLVTENKLPPSYYRLQFFTAAPWEPKKPPADPPEDSFLAVTTTPQDHLQWLANQLEKHPQREFLLRFERACVYATIKDQRRCDEEIAWCYHNLDGAAPEMIIALHDWIGKRDKATQDAIRIQMYRPRRLMRLFELFPRPNPTRRAYLKYFPYTRIIKPESAQVILKHQTDTVFVLHCLQALLKYEDPQSILEICQRVSDGQLSDADAQALMEQKAAFALGALGNLPPTPTTTRLLTSLAKTVPDQQIFITPGHWVLTDAGWGRIERIVDTETQSELNYFNAQNNTPSLWITLRPQSKPEKAVLDLCTRTLSFSDVAKLFQCAYEGCKFATADRSLLLNDHNHHAHGGINPRFRPISSGTFPVRKPARYSRIAPANEFIGD